MKGKIFYIVLIIAFIFPTASIVSSLGDDLIEIQVTIGQNKGQIGFGIITIDIKNNKSEEVMVYYNSTFDRVYSMEIPQFYFEKTIVPPGKSKEIVLDVKERIGSSWYPIIIFNVDIIVETEDVSIEKTGLAIRKLIIFF